MLGVSPFTVCSTVAHQACGFLYTFPTGLIPDFLRPYIGYAERWMIWEHVKAHGALPVCNSG